MERLKSVQLLSDTDKLDRDAGDRFDRERGSTSGVSVQLGQNHAVQLERLVERFGAVDRVLPRHRVADQQRLVRHQLVVDRDQLAHQVVINVQPACRIENQQIATLAVRFFPPFCRL